MSLWTPYAEQALDLSRSVQDECAPPARLGYQYGATPPPAAAPAPATCWSAMAPSPPQSPDLYDAESVSDDVEYQAFERDALRAMAERNGGSLLGDNPRMRRAVQTSRTAAAGDSYRKQRERNNFAAKQSRDRRKLREMRLAFQVTFLKRKLSVERARLAERLCARCQQQCIR